MAIPKAKAKAAEEMAKAKKKSTMYICSQCGYSTPQYIGRCPEQVDIFLAKLPRAEEINNTEEITL